MKLRIFAIAALVLGALLIALDPYASYEGDWRGYIYAFAPFAITSILLFVRKKECDLGAGIIFTILIAFNCHFVYILNSPEPTELALMSRGFLSMFEFGLAVFMICIIGGMLAVKQSWDWQ